MKKLSVLALISIFTMVGCGQKGPLYLTGDQSVGDGAQQEAEVEESLEEIPQEEQIQEEQSEDDDS